MCWHVKIKITTQDRIKTFDDSYLNKINSYFQFEGLFPYYEILHNGCLCDYFREKKDQNENILDLIEKVISNEQVKKICIQKYWTTEKKNPEEIKITLSEFLKIVQNNEWKENVIYRLINHLKFV
jgi:hypothetical protein